MDKPCCCGLCGAAASLSLLQLLVVLLHMKDSIFSWSLWGCSISVLAAAAGGLAAHEGQHLGLLFS